MAVYVSVYEGFGQRNGTVESVICVNEFRSSRRLFSLAKHYEGLGTPSDFHPIIDAKTHPPPKTSRMPPLN